MKNWIINKLGGFTSEEMSEQVLDLENSNKRNKGLVSENNTLKGSLVEEEKTVRKLNVEIFKTKKQTAVEISRLTLEISKDLDKLNKIRKDFDIQKRGYGRMKTRNFRARALMKDVEFRSTKGMGVKWVDYESYGVLGDELLRLRNILDGERDNDKKPKGPRDKFRFNQKK